MRDQRVDERPGGVSGGGMHDEPGRLVDDDQIVVFVDDIERQALTFNTGRLRRRQGNFIDGARFDRGSRLPYRPAAAHMPVSNQGLNTRTAQVVDLVRQPAIDPLAGVLGPAVSSSKVGDGALVGMIGNVQKKEKRLR